VSRIKQQKAREQVLVIGLRLHKICISNISKKHDQSCELGNLADHGKLWVFIKNLNR
jgi:hypothetical protein